MGHPSGVLTLSQSALKKSILVRLGGDSVGSSAGGEQLAQSAKNPAQVVQDQAQVVAGATEERVDRVASHHTGGCGRACSLRVADHRFERRLSSRRIRGREAAPLAGDGDLGSTPHPDAAAVATPPPPLAPLAPQPVARPCWSASLLLCGGLTSRVRASPAKAPHLPGADRRQRTSRPDARSPRFTAMWDHPHMPRSPTKPGRAGTRVDAPVRTALRHENGVGTLDNSYSAAQWLADSHPAYASPPPSRTTAHGSGPMRIATPSS
jgi:hypothetical protein